MNRGPVHRRGGSKILNNANNNKAKEKNPRCGKWEGTVDREGGAESKVWGSSLFFISEPAPAVLLSTRTSLWNWSTPSELWVLIASLPGGPGIIWPSIKPRNSKPQLHHKRERKEVLAQRECHLVSI